MWRYDRKIVSPWHKVNVHLPAQLSPISYCQETISLRGIDFCSSNQRHVADGRSLKNSLFAVQAILVWPVRCSGHPSHTLFAIRAFLANTSLFWRLRKRAKFIRKKYLLKGRYPILTNISLCPLIWVICSCLSAVSTDHVLRGARASISVFTFQHSKAFRQLCSRYPNVSKSYQA